MQTTRCTVVFCALGFGAAAFLGCQPTPEDQLAARDLPAISAALIASAKTADVEAVRLLLGADVDPDRADGDGMTALAWAVGGDDVATVEALTTAGASLAGSAGNDGMTLLMRAAQIGSLAVVQVLAEAGAPTDAQDDFGNTALLQAAAGGHRDVAAYLLARGANPDSSTTQSGATPLGVSAARGDAPMVALLLGYGASTEVRESAFGLTPLAVAAFKGHLEVARLLLQAGADVSAVDRDDQTPLAIATTHGHQRVRTLLASAQPKRARHDGTGLFRRQASFQPPPGWVLADPFTRRTPFFPATATLSTVGDPAGTRRALLRGSNESGSQAFLLCGPAKAWADTLRTEIEELASHPLVEEHPVREVRTADDVRVVVREFRMFPGLIGGDDTTYVLASVVVGGEVLVLDAGGPTETFSPEVVLEIVTALDLSRDLGLVRDVRPVVSRPGS